MSITLFGLFAVFGFIISGFFLWKRAIDEHVTEAEVFDMYITASIWALVAARVGSIMLRFDRFGWNPLRWLALFSLPGLDGRFALVIGMLMIILGALKRRWNPWLTLDMYVPSVLLWQSALVVLYWWQLAAFWFAWFLLLWWIEHEYRLWEWYRGRRGFAHPGLVSSVWLIGIGVGLLLIALLTSASVVFFASGGLCITIGLIFVYVRSGRVLKADVESISNRIDHVIKTLKKRKPQRTILSP